MSLAVSYVSARRRRSPRFAGYAKPDSCAP